LRLLRQHDDDIGLTIRLNAQYGSMVRASLSVHGRLMRIQALRQKRQAIEGAANEDAWALHIAERSMLEIEEPDAGPRATASSEAAQPALPAAAPTADGNQTIEAHVSENRQNSQDAAFETWLSTQFRSRVFGQPNGSRLHGVVREAMAEPHPAGDDPPIAALRAVGDVKEAKHENA
jgi:hypothetical protein